MLKRIFVILALISSLLSQAQNNSIHATIELKDSIETLYIYQKIVYYNKTGITLKNIYLHDWANSFKNNETPLAKRFLDDYEKKFYFSKKKDRGHTEIKELRLNNQKGNYYISKDQPDIINIDLNQSLTPKDSVIISMAYQVKIPNSEFTGYGKTEQGYHLRFWQIIPAIYQNGWQLMSNLNMDDLFQDIANYRLEVKIPVKYRLESNLYQYRTTYKYHSQYYLIGNNKKDIILSINKKDPYISIKLNAKEIKTDAYDAEISKEQTNAIIRKQVEFIESYIGKVPFTELFIDKRTINKNTLHEIYGLPDWLKPFPENFKWEINFFHSLCSKYINNLIIHNKRKAYWFSEGLQTYLMMEYLQKYYPKTTLLGKYSEYWPLKNYNISKLKQADKYAFVYQFSARRFFDQALNTSSDSLSNFNRKVVSRYKAGLGFKYLQDYIGKDTLQRSLKKYLRTSNLKPSTPKQFLKILENNTTKDIKWFKDNYLKTSKKIDYTITDVKKTEGEDSLKITIKNKRSFAAPIAIYGIANKRIKHKKWIPPIDSTATITLKNDAFSKIALNYENIYPEYNSLDNFRTVTNKLINKPLQFKLFKDIEDPYYNQLFYLPTVKYNLYDGLIVGLRINNRPLITHNFKFTVNPNYGIKSNDINGSFSVLYDHYFQTTNIYRIQYGLQGSTYNYAPDLRYNAIVPYLTLNFRRRNLRDVGSKSFSARLFNINKDIAPNTISKDEDNYKVLNFRYIHNKPNVIKRLQYAVNLEFGSSFTKLSTDIRYRKFFALEKSFDIRFFGGIFLNNNSDTSYFDFGLNQSSDYLFEQNLFGRSENSGVFSQQFIISDGGFKSNFKQPYTANQYIFAGNTSVSVWKWVEVYNDAAVLKNSEQKRKFFYENGIRLNFIPNIFELYFPIYTNEGWEFNKEAYPSKIRFVFTTNIDQIYNFIRRGIL